MKILILLAILSSAVRGHADVGAAQKSQDVDVVREILKMNQQLVEENRDLRQKMVEMEREMRVENKALKKRLDVLEKADKEPVHQNASHNPARRLILNGNDGPVAFLASLAAQQREEHLGVNQNIMFDTVLTNVGGAFNVNHGIFTVPVTGIYLISTTVMSWIDTEVRASIMVNGKRQVSVFGHGSVGRHEQGTQVAVLQLNVGDTVSVENIDLTDIAIWGDRYTSFTGVLLYQNE